MPGFSGSDGANVMENGWLSDWLAGLPVAAVGLGTFAAMVLAGIAGQLVRRSEWARQIGGAEAVAEEGLLVSGTLGMLALLLAFTFSMSLSRYETRRELVTKEANAIGTAYLRAQLLDEPHRARLSNLLLAYTENRVALGSGHFTQARLRTNDRLLTTIWAAVAASRDSALVHGLTTPLLLAFNEVIDLDTDRKVSRQIRVPGDVVILLLLYLVTSAAVVGHAVSSNRSRAAAAVLFVLLALAIMVITDLNQPAAGRMREPQLAMVLLLQSLRAQPPEAFDQFGSVPVASALRQHGPNR
jgi:membrane protein YdbS with pleckstrin-like domain